MSASCPAPVKKMCKTGGADGPVRGKGGQYGVPGPRRDANRDTGDNDLRGVLLLTAGELPPAYLRFAFLDTPLARIGGCTLVVARSERVDLVASIEQGYGDGSLTDEEYQGLMTGIDQRHPA